jgi:hypothetical protein
VRAASALLSTAVKFTWRLTAGEESSEPVVDEHTRTTS